MRWICNPPQPDRLASELDHIPCRTLSADAYWQRLSVHLNAFGISRVADITGLDYLGFPVAQAVRPLACSNVATQGKASTLAGAAVGAVLECLEMAAGETMDRFAPARVGSAKMWAPFAPAGVIWPDAQTDFIAAWDLVRNERTSIPRDLICTNFSLGAKSQNAPILRHSIGLGAGTSLSSAMMHGLLECIEADARLRAEFAGGAQRLKLSLEDPDYGAVLKLIEMHGLRASVSNLPCKGGIIAVKASVMERPNSAALPLPAAGYAARTILGASIAAALAEALQARLAVISGAREDITQQFYTHNFAQADLEAEWDRHAVPEMPAVADEVPSQPTSVRELVKRVGRVFAVPLHWDSDLPLAITRIVALDLIADPHRLVHA